MATTTTMTASGTRRPRLRIEKALSPGARRLAGSVSATLLGQAVLLGGLFLITRISVQSFGAVGFGEYQVARRTLAVVAFPLMCGLGVGLPRYIARGMDDRAEVARSLYAGGLLAAALLTVFLVGGVLWSDEIGRWTFGAGRERGLVFPLLAAIVGVFGHTLTLAALRGMSRFRAAAVWQVVNGALVPLAGVLLAGGHVGRALGIAAGLWCGLAGGVYLALCREWAPPLRTELRLRAAVTEMLVFGAPRVPGDIALFGLFALPVYTAVERHDIVGAGFLSVGLSLIQGIAAVFASAGFVMLPYWSRVARDPGALGVARRRMTLVVLSSAAMAAVALAGLQLFLRPTARLLLGPLASAGLHDLRSVAVAVVPYVVYLVLRDYLDAIAVVPLNTLALCTAIATEAALLHWHWFGVPGATVAGFFTLGLATLALWAASSRRRGVAPLAPAAVLEGGQA